MSPEERLRLRKQAHNDDSKLSVPAAIEDENSSVRSGFEPAVRPISTVSGSTTSARSTEFEEAVEEPLPSADGKRDASLSTPLETRASSTATSATDRAK